MKSCNKHFNLLSKPTMKNKLAYASGDILGGGAFGLVGLLFLGFLVFVEGMSPLVAGSIVLAGEIWDAFTDPIMGKISDRTRSRFGRRRLWLLVGIIPVATSFFMIWYSFGIANMTAKIVYYLVAYLFFNTAMTIVMVPYNALLPDMVSDYKERANFMTIRMAFSIVSVILSTILPTALVGMPVGPSQKIPFALMGLGFGLLYALPLVFTFKGTYEVRGASATDLQKTNLKKIFCEYFSVLKNKSFRKYAGIFLLGQGATDIVSTTLPFFLLCVIGKPNLGMIVLGVTVGMDLLCLPLNLSVAKKFGKNFPSVFNFPVRILALLTMMFFTKETPIAVVVAIAIFMGFGQSAASFVPWNILPDLSDVDEMMTGQRREGLYSGAATFFRKATSGLGVWLVGLVLTLFGFNENLGVNQSETAQLGVRLVYSIVPAVMSFAVIFFAKTYKVDAKAHELILKSIQSKRLNEDASFSANDVAVFEKITGQKMKDMWIGR